MQRFDTVTFDKTTSLTKKGMEVKSYIAGVNSGEYGFPFVIAIRAWASKWFFKKFFYQEMKLNYFEVKILRDECNKVIEWYEEKQQKEK